MVQLMTKRLLLTGAGGFIGAHVLEHVLSTTDWDVVALDSFRHKGKTDRISQILDTMRPDQRARVQVVTHDLAAPFSSQLLSRIVPVDYVIAMASGSSVDRSLEDPSGFIRNNTDVILNTLEFCRNVLPAHVVVISTDEVYGPSREPLKEWAPILPSSPYSASKAAQEAIAFSYWRSYNVPVTIVNCMNLIGQRQDVEKFLPRLISYTLADREIGIHGTEENIGSRLYLHARNLADALVHILKGSTPVKFPIADRPRRYNVTGPDRLTNLELAELVAQIVGRPLRYKLIDFAEARPGHDPHYAIDGSKLAAAGWKPPIPLELSIRQTVEWTLKHREWLLP